MIAFCFLALLCGASSLPQDYYQNQGRSQGRQLGSGGFGFSGNQRQTQPTYRVEPNFIPTIRDNRYGPINGHYTFDFETGNGIIRSEEGNPTAPNGAVVVNGEWSHPFDNGESAQFSFLANEYGYQPQSNLLPVPPPIPFHSQQQIERGERERSAGINHGGNYDPVAHGGGFYDPSRHGGGDYVPGQY